MDIALCAYDHGSQLLRFSGVGNPLYHIAYMSGELVEYRTDNHPGQSDEGDRQGYEELEIPMVFGDVLYLGSEGFADQFGGAARKK